MHMDRESPFPGSTLSCTGELDHWSTLLIDSSCLRTIFDTPGQMPIKIVRSFLHVRAVIKTRGMHVGRSGEKVQESKFEKWFDQVHDVTVHGV